MVNVALMLSLEGLLFCGGFLNFLFVRSQAVFDAAQFYFDVSLVRFVI